MDVTALADKTKRIEQAAFELGFDGFGISRPFIEESQQRLHKWLSLHFEGEMSYLRAEKRLAPDKVLPGVKSVVCLRLNYFTLSKDLGYLNHPGQGDISLYALNKDYHEVILPKLEQLEKTIHIEFPDCRTKTYVDTGPVLEKPLAQNAGLGWIGKHTNLVSEGIGSWYFLAEIMVDVQIPESAPAINRCGTCHECIDICPTQAIVAPYVLDARRCISYLTIELKGAIPLEFRKAIGNRIYGCDDCQIVCPWNSFAKHTGEAAFQGLTGWHLIDLIRMDDETFRNRFRKSPIKRLKRRGLLRNIAVALGNSGNRDAVEPLIEVLRDKEPLIRAHAVWALGELLLEKSPTVVRQYPETDETVLTEIRRLETRFAPVRKGL